MEPPKIGSIYKHLKSDGQYRVIALAKGQFEDGHDMEDLVVYESVADNPVSKHWVRPLKDFIPRFSFVREA